MADIKVIAYFMHEHEQAAATAAVKNARITDSYVIGEIDETRVGDLQQAGLIVERLRPPVSNLLEGLAPMFELKGARATHRAETADVPVELTVVDPNQSQSICSVCPNHFFASTATVSRLLECISWSRSALPRTSPRCRQPSSRPRSRSSS
jgi:hypothetical protein